VLWGGEDISPSIYKQRSVKAHAADHPSLRDMAEIELAKEAVRLGIPILGICRGSQLLCALAGGTLWQHVDNHNRDHFIQYGDTRILATSTHHQMMRPTKEHTVLATATEVRSPFKYAESAVAQVSEEPEAEIVYFNNINALGVQGHPEYVPTHHPFPQLVKTLVKKHLNREILV
jgi:putative glutamine amidotransferase